MPIRLDLYAPSERSYIPIQLPLPLEVVLPNPRSIVTYARVSSDEQRDRHTVLNQRAALDRRLASEPGLHVSSSITRMTASRVLSRSQDSDRVVACWSAMPACPPFLPSLGGPRRSSRPRRIRAAPHLENSARALGVALRATDENIDDPFSFDIHAVIAANERRKFLERSAEGMNRAAKEGRYTGGIVPLGYSVSGDRGARRLVPDDSPMWADLSAADVVRRIYHHLAAGLEL